MPYHSHNLTRLDREGEPIQSRTCFLILLFFGGLNCGVTENHIPKINTSIKRWCGNCVWLIAYLRRQIYKITYPFQTGIQLAKSVPLGDQFLRGLEHIIYPYDEYR